jgi:hypothetical protein
MEYKPSMCFAPAGMDACGLWRMWMPHLNIPTSRFLFTEGMPNLNEMAECDVVVVQRLMLQGNLHFLQLARSHGLKIIYDLDDDVWDIPKNNPAASFFRSKENVTGLQSCAEWADILTVSTKQLANVVDEKWGWLRNVATKKPIPVVHIDNAVDLNIFQASPIRQYDDNAVVIGWGGSNTHAGDIALVWNLLPDLLERYSNVYLEFVGHNPPQKIANHPRVKIRPWCHISEFHGRFATWDWDIVLAPLEQHRFNKSKSSIKMVEAGCIGSPCLAQNIAPYKYFTSFKENLQWLLCDDFDWSKKLHTLITEKDMRRDLGALMYENVKDNFNITRTAPLWQEVCQLAL